MGYCDSSSTINATSDTIKQLSHSSTEVTSISQIIGSKFEFVCDYGYRSTLDSSNAYHTCSAGGVPAGSGIWTALSGQCQCMLLLSPETLCSHSLTNQLASLFSSIFSFSIIRTFMAVKTRTTRKMPIKNLFYLYISIFPNLECRNVSHSRNRKYSLTLILLPSWLI